ncbi:hypothetical protein WKW80_28410 [Variovorax humicola]|uniref:Uncharacterized protein n=1 Tax=Variovorax humicola TaxID=1769758 RepID=A0ABU8W775_9BURK
MRDGATQIELQFARESAIALLQRSVAMKHDRLAMHRLVDALNLKASVDAHAWDNCTAMASDPARFAALAKTFPSFPRLVQEMSGQT